MASHCSTFLGQTFLCNVRTCPHNARKFSTRHFHTIWGHVSQNQATRHFHTIRGHVLTLLKLYQESQFSQYHKSFATFWGHVLTVADLGHVSSLCWQKLHFCTLASILQSEDRKVFLFCHQGPAPVKKRSILAEKMLSEDSCSNRYAVQEKLKKLLGEWGHVLTSREDLTSSVKHSTHVLKL